jgi:lysophospholipase L1-like esterase
MARSRTPFGVLWRAALALAVAALACVLVIGVQIELAIHRTYDPTEPPLAIGGRFGPPDGHPLTFVVLGDSTAAGVGAGDAAHAYPTLLAERLASHGRLVHLLDFGVSGARVRDVLNDQVPKALAASPDVVFVGIGANDATHLSSLSGVRADMADVLARLRHPGAIVVVAGAPNMRTPAFLPPLRWVIGWGGDQVAAAIDEVAHVHHVPVVPLAAATGAFFADPSTHAYSADRFHPGPAGYARWADAIDPVLEAALAGR